MRHLSFLLLYCPSRALLSLISSVAGHKGHAPAKQKDQEVAQPEEASSGADNGIESQQLARRVGKPTAAVCENGM
jgi:hypothetical protein